MLVNENTPPWTRKKLTEMGYKLEYNSRTSGPINAIFFDRNVNTLSLLSSIMHMLNINAVQNYPLPRGQVSTIPLQRWLVPHLLRLKFPFSAKLEAVPGMRCLHRDLRSGANVLPIESNFVWSRIDSPSMGHRSGGILRYTNMMYSIML